MSDRFRVVILDDEPWSREVVKSLADWERLGLEVVGEADDGDAGLALIRSVDPQIVITDMRMPGMNGPELLSAISSELPEVRIVVMSGYDDFPYLRGALLSRAEDYLLKPIDPDELNRTLEKCVLALRSPGDRRPASMRTPIVFADAGVLEAYVDHRRRVFAFLLELDDEAIRTTLKQLRKFLESAPGVSLDEELANRVAHDFLLMLEEFMVRNGMTVDPSIIRPRALGELSGAEPLEAIARVFDTVIGEMKQRRGGPDRLDLAEVKAHIDAYYRDPLSLHSVARLFLVSKEHLSRVFRRQYGTTVNDYITGRRMQAAHELLTAGDLEIKEIALLVGYNDLAYFYRVFKKQFGMPPGKVHS
jgi:two-component system, response regulator YesN